MTHDISHKNTSHIAITHVKNLSGKRLQKGSGHALMGLPRVWMTLVNTGLNPA